MSQVMARVAGETAAGEQVAVVVSSADPAEQLSASLSDLLARGCQVVVCIAIGRRTVAAGLAQAQALRRAASLAGAATFMEAP